jgi:hypothetical protein
MQAVSIILLMLAFDACQYRQRAVMTAPPKEVVLESGCSAKIKTVKTLTDQLGTVIHSGKLIFISLPPPNTDIIQYLACNLPDGLLNGQKVRFSAQLKYQPGMVNGAVVDYIGKEIELTKLTLL